MTHVTPQPQKRSMGLKLLLVCALALLMSIPATFVWALIYERTARADRTITEIGQLVGGPQQFMGPVLAIPYRVPPIAAQNGQGGQEAIRGTWIVFPKLAEATGEAETEVRKRGLFRAPVWTADLTLKSSFDLTGAGSGAPAGAVLDWSRAEILVGASDARGAKENTLTINGERVAMRPAVSIGQVGMEQTYDDVGPRAMRVDGPSTLQFFGAPVAGLAPGQTFDAQAQLKFSGAQRIAVLAYGEDTRVSLSGDWPSPSYDGGFPTTDHVDRAPAGTKTGDGKGYFKGNWSVPITARGVAGEGNEAILGQLGSTSLGVTFVENANPYQAVSRSLKYAPIFLGLVFFTYFVFESTQKKRMHPAQYILVGLAQLIFYLLLLAIAERIGFDYGFLAAAVATVSLISAYAAWTFESRSQGVVALIAFSVLYGLIYVLMRLQDWALLVGAVTSFTAIAAVMYFTRKLDWYGDKTPVTTA